MLYDLFSKPAEYLVVGMPHLAILGFVASVVVANLWYKAAAARRSQGLRNLVFRVHIPCAVYWALLSLLELVAWGSTLKRFEYLLLAPLFSLCLFLQVGSSLVGLIICLRTKRVRTVTHRE